MKQIFQVHEWQVIEEGLHLEDNRLAESVMSLGNGYMGMRGNFEEQFSGDTLQGTYFAGVYYPDKTRVGWWKNGYPEYFAKVLNAVNFIGVDISVHGEPLDLAKAECKDFKRVLHMQKGRLERSFTLVDDKKRETRFSFLRFVSLEDKEICGIEVRITPLNHDAVLEITPYLDGNVSNEDSNYGEMFWSEEQRIAGVYSGQLGMRTKKPEYFVVHARMHFDILLDGEKKEYPLEVLDAPFYVGNKVCMAVKENSEVILQKYVAVVTCRDHPEEIVPEVVSSKLAEAVEKGFATLLQEHTDRFLALWEESDITIENDDAAQQGIRFNIFHLNQTYTGEDPRLNIGPKGFTGEKYGGSTYWDTEAYCLPFYLSTRDPKIARNLLVYRYRHLEKAKENARKLGLRGALYPMVTMNGEECHNEWEITFEEIHRNAAITYAIFNYVRYTTDVSYLGEYGFEVLVETSRFWESRVTRQPDGCYMILGVTGPNEYENNVNNNWYTNKMAAWSLQYTLEVNRYLKEKEEARHLVLASKLGLTEEELAKWEEISSHMYYPYLEEEEVFEQQDQYRIKEQMLVKELNPKELPLNQNWSWDRILRSCFIKQADVLQGIFFLQDQFDLKTKKRNFDYYEPRTVHESSLSPCVYSIIAAEVGYEEKAYELYLRTSRLDLDNYNNDTEDGLHITSMAGTWMSVVYGFGGMRVENETLTFKPVIPKAWDRFSFKVGFLGRLLLVTVTHKSLTIELKQGADLEIQVYESRHVVSSSQVLNLPKS